MATGFMPHFIAILLFLLGPTAWAADVALIGLIGDKAAVLAVDGGDPKTVKVGQKWSGISVIAVERGEATVEIDGKRRLLKAHQEREIGERIEAAQSKVVAAMADIPGAVQTLLALADRIRAAGAPANELILLTEGGELQD